MKREIPTFSENRLNGLMAAFRKRSKAIKHRGGPLVFTKEEEEGYERLNIDCCQIGPPPIQIRISVWEDREMYFRTCQSSKNGWRFNIGFYGKAFLVDEAKIVSNFEESLYLSDKDELMSSWGRISPYME